MCPANRNQPSESESSLDETKRIMERLVRTPPKPHGRDKDVGKRTGPTNSTTDRPAETRQTSKR